MAIDGGTFETLIPSQFISFTFPNPDHPKTSLSHYGDTLRIAVLDSHEKTPDPPLVVAMLVPEQREDDWIFSTETGHIQLLSNWPEIARLILIGNLPFDGDCFPTVFNRTTRIDALQNLNFEKCLTPLLLALSPKVNFRNSLPDIPFVAYEDDVICSLSVERYIGSCVGEMLVEDVEIDGNDEIGKFSIREFRRRLRFKRMPNFIQTQIRIVPAMKEDSIAVGIGEVEFLPDTSILVHPYLPPMVASLSLIAPYMEECVRSGSRPRALCVGVGGGALLTYLHNQFEFEVIGVEADQTVLRIAQQHFGLVDGEFLRICVGDGVKVLEKFAQQVIHQNSSFSGAGDLENKESFDMFGGCKAKFDVIMVDLDSSDARNGTSAPPLELIQKQVLLNTKLSLHRHGILVINVIPKSRSFYDNLIREFREVYPNLYEIEVENAENYVLIASDSPIGVSSIGRGDSILKKLKLAISGPYLDSITTI